MRQAINSFCDFIDIFDPFSIFTITPYLCSFLSNCPWNSSVTSFSPKRLSKQSKSQTFALWLREPNSYPLYNFITIPYSKTSAPFSIDPKKCFNHFRILLKMTLNALTFRKLYEKPSLTLSTFKVKKHGKPKHFPTHSSPFWESHFLRSCTRDYIFFCSRTSRKTTSAACLVGLFFLFFFST